MIVFAAAVERSASSGRAVERAAARSPASPPVAVPETQVKAELASALRDAADLAAMHHLSLPDALREVADRLAAPNA